jgi:hypothetical protein
MWREVYLNSVMLSIHLQEGKEEEKERNTLARLAGLGVAGRDKVKGTGTWHAREWYTKI